jgi:hypothetical protein
MDTMRASLSIAAIVTGNVLDLIAMSNPNPVPVYKSYSFTMEGTTPGSVPTLRWTTICGNTRPEQGYTATATTLQLMNGNTGNGTWLSVSTFTKR